MAYGNGQQCCTSSLLIPTYFGARGEVFETGISFALGCRKLVAWRLAEHAGGYVAPTSRCVAGHPLNVCHGRPLGTRGFETEGRGPERQVQATPACEYRFFPLAVNKQIYGCVRRCPAAHISRM